MFQKKDKSIFNFIVYLCVVFVLSGCVNQTDPVPRDSVSLDYANHQEEKIKLIPEQTIVEIKVSSLPEGYHFVFSDTESINEIVNYFNDLNLIKDFKENPDEYAGMTWVVEISFDDGSSMNIYHFGNMFVRAGEESWYKMDYEEAAAFDSILTNLNN